MCAISSELIGLQPSMGQAIGLTAYLPPGLHSMASHNWDRALEVCDAVFALAWEWGGCCVSSLALPL